MGLPWWLSGKESVLQCKRHRFDPWSGKIPHAAENLSSCTTTAEQSLGSRPRELQPLSPHTATADAQVPESRCSARQALTWQLWNSFCSQWRPSTLKKKKSGLSTSQEEGPHQEPHLSAPWSWTSQPLELWQINVCHFSHPVYGSLLKTPELAETKE